MFTEIKYRKSALLLGLVALVFVIAGCVGNTSGGEEGDKSFAGTQFVATDAAAGAIALAVTSTRLSVGATTGFTVTVTDANGATVPNVQISCDTEEGLALIEPTTGEEMTGGFGTMSGVVGCEAPGSFQIGCRLPIGGNKRKFQRIVCEGPVPSGFTGFSGAGGGGLGGGSFVSEDGGAGGTDTSGFSIQSVKVADDGNLSGDGSFEIDTSQGTCGTPPDTTSEPFFDSFLVVKVLNNLTSEVRCNSLTYTIPNSGISGFSTSSSISFVGVADANGSEATFVVHFMDANSGGKLPVGASSNIGSIGFRNVSVRLSCKTDLESFSVSKSVSLSFDNYSRCTS
ncbi:MAG: hypothetical protein D6719_01305 [Candidatus Dadabacteria bacterium]|nr:MAG: hypothetical protein D6719_01305 [Candidatus Dadabacteria bacterium]